MFCFNERAHNTTRHVRSLGDGIFMANADAEDKANEERLPWSHTRRRQNLGPNCLAVPEMCSLCYANGITQGFYAIPAAPPPPKLYPLQVRRLIEKVATVLVPMFLKLGSRCSSKLKG